MKVLVVDDDIDFRELAQVLVNRSYPRANVTGYDPQKQGLPAADFPWADFDVVLLDYELSSEQTGLDWLRRYGTLPGFPAVIFATGAGDENLAARAMKFGADEYLSKREISAERLGELISSVLAERASTIGVDAVNPTREVNPLFSPDLVKVPGYVLRRLLGCGGTADVYLSERESDGHTVVLKIVREGMANNTQILERMRREARILSSMDSAHVVRVYEHGEHGGRGYMVMEYLGHGDMSARITEGLAVSEVRTYAHAIATGLVAVHDHGVVHRDLKPSNIMFRYDDSLALTDFGISRYDTLDEDMTESGSVVGTPFYMSPEQCDGVAVDGRSDQYSLGIMLFEMLVGYRPFTGDSATAVFLKHLSAPIPRLPSELEMFQPVVDRLMAKDPAQRYPSARELVIALDAI